MKVWVMREILETTLRNRKYPDHKVIDKTAFDTACERLHEIPTSSAEEVISIMENAIEDYEMRVFGHKVDAISSVRP